MTTPDDKKSKRATGKPFERLVFRVYEHLCRDDSGAQVEMDVQLDSPDGPRQFDVVVRSQVAGHDILTVVECRDYPRKNIDVTHVDGFHSKMRSVNASKGVLVASKGFSGGAQKKAARLGITLCTAHDLHTGLNNVGRAVPVTLTKVSRILVNPKFYLEAGVTYLRQAYIDGVPIIRAIAQAIRSGQLPLHPLNSVRVWGLPPESSCYMETSGKERILAQGDVCFELQGEYYFGHLSDLPGTYGLADISKGTESIFFSADDILAYEKTLKRYTSLHEVPQSNGVGLHVLIDPQLQVDGTNGWSIGSLR